MTMADLGQTHGGDVATVCSDLIRINTSNPTHVEREAAEYVATALSRCDLEYEWFEPADGRVSLVTRLPGRERELPPLLVHTHLDTVPADPAEWSRDPFSGAIEDGFVWGRGAVDMKGMVAAVLEVVRQYRSAGRQPR